MAKTAKFQPPPNPYASKIMYTDVAAFQKILDKFPQSDVIRTKTDLLKWVQNVYKKAHREKEHSSLKIEEIIQDTLNDNATAVGRITPTSNKDILDGIKGKTGAFLDFLEQDKFREYAADKIVIKKSYTSIRPDEYDTHVEEVKKLGYSPVQAKWLVYDYVLFMTGEKDCVRVDSRDYEEKLADDAAKLRKQKCTCGEYSDENAAVCCACRKPLKCPKCKSGTSGTENCLNCGNGPFIAVEALKKARAALASGDIAGAEKLMCQVSIHWSECPGAEELGKNVKKIKGETAIAAAKKAFSTLDIENCKKYVAEAERDYPQHDQISVLKKQLTELEERRKREQADLILQSVLPPKSFTAAETHTGTIKLIWDAVTFSKPMGNQKTDITYIIVRKEDAVPVSEKDGETLARTQELRFEDTTTKVGQVYGYSVFPSAFGITKEKGTAARDKIIRTASVSQLQIFSGDGTTRLTWQTPNKAVQIAIVRKKGAIPKDVKDGERLPTGNALNGYVDSNLVNNQTYGYLVAPLFKGTQGEYLQGAAATTSGTPRALPPTPGKVLWQVDEQGLDIQWKVVPNGNFKFYLSESPLGKQGDSLELHAAVFSNATEITACNHSQGRGRYPKLLTKPVYLTPVSKNQHVALLGEAVLVVPVQNVKNFTINRDAGDIILKWDWPDTVEEVLLVHRSDGSPTSLEDEKAGRIVITREIYQNKKGYTIHRAGNDNYYFLVAATAGPAGQLQTSAPLQFQSIGPAGRTELQYELVRKRSGIFSGTFIHLLRIKVVKGNSGIPELALRKSRGSLPLRSTDGNFVLKIERCNANATEVTLPDEIIEKGAYYKLFPYNSNEAGIITIDHPMSDKMKF